VTDVTDKVQTAIARFERVARHIDERDGPVRAAARRERQRLNTDLMTRVKRVGVAIGLVSVITILVGFVTPIGMFGFLAAVGLAIGIAALLAFGPSAETRAAAPSTDLPNGEMVQRFDSYLYRSRRAAARTGPSRSSMWRATRSNRAIAVWTLSVTSVT
jgi:hypothetical protein